MQIIRISKAMSIMINDTIDKEKQILVNRIKTLIKPSGKMTMKKICDTVCTYYSVDVDKVKSNVRKKEFVLARYMIFYLIVEIYKLDYSQEEIAWYFNRDNRSTISHAVRYIKRRVSRHGLITKQANDIIGILNKTKKRDVLLRK